MTLWIVKGNILYMHNFEVNHYGLPFDIEEHRRQNMPYGANASLIASRILSMQTAEDIISAVITSEVDCTDVLAVAQYGLYSIGN